MEWLILYRQLLNAKLRWFILLIAGLLVSIFFSTFLHSTSVYAADATWDGHDLTYSNKKYTRLTDNNKVKKFNLPDNSLVFINEDKNKKEVKVIYFPSGEISSLSSATYAVYSFTPPDTYNQTDTSTISIDPPSENSTSTSCDVQGIGWFICPVSNWLADGIDFMYSALQQFLKTKPLETTNQNSGIYLAWVIMRNISNVAFIVAFLVIIYSQLTSVGISNYGVKKMIPRLVIAAVLVNLSFTICAILLDLSNIAGYAFQDAFMGIKNTISTVGENTGVGWTWSEVIMLILSNGAFAAGAAYTISLGSELLPLALSAVVGIGLVLLLVLLIMAARQALIVILIIISPLAFVCYLLPGTEKWFKKWKDLFLTMLVFFPAFSVVFGGAQLAGILIIQNATGPNGGIMQILGMVVQVIPLALTPIILKFSGGVLGKFAGFVNDKNKGWYDKSKNWAKDKREITRNKKLSNENMRLKRLNPNSLRRWVDHNSRARKKSLETSQKNAENSFRNTARYKRLDLEARQASRRADLLSEQDSNRYLEATQGYMTDNIYKLPFYDRALRAKSTKYSNWRDAKSYQQQAQFMSDIKDLETEIAMAGLIKNNAQRQQHSEFAEQLINSKELREKAGGNVFKDANGNLIGANAALASAIATSRSEYAKSVDEARQIIKHYKLSSEERQGLALGRTSINLPGGVRLTRDSIFVREAAIEEQIKYGTAAEVAELLSELPPEFRASAASALAESGVKNKASFLGGKLVDDTLKGVINNRSDLMNYFANWLEGGKYKPETLATTDADAVKLLMEAVNTTSVLTNEGRQDLKEAIDTILTDKRLSANATKATKEQFKIFRNML
jgi:hypothetical protein cdiviTM7_01065